MKTCEDFCKHLLPAGQTYCKAAEQAPYNPKEPPWQYTLVPGPECPELLLEELENEAPDCWFDEYYCGPEDRKEYNKQFERGLRKPTPQTPEDD